MRNKRPPLPVVQNGWALLPPEYNVQNFTVQNTLLLAQNVAAGEEAYLCFFLNDSSHFLVIRSIRTYAQRFVPSDKFVGIEAQEMPPGALVGRVGWQLVVNNRPSGIRQIGYNVASKTGEQGYFNAPQADTPDKFAGFQFLDEYNSNNDFGPVIVKPKNNFGIKVLTFDADAAADFPDDGIQFGASIEGYAVPITKNPYKNC